MYDGTGSSIDTASVGSSFADEQVAPRPEPVDDPVEVALGLPVALVVGQARPAAMLVAFDRQTVEPDGPAGRAPLPFVAKDEAPPDVEVAIEAEPLVERAAVGGVGATERLEIALDGVDIAGRCVVEMAQVGGRDAPSARDGHRRIVEGARPAA